MRIVLSLLFLLSSAALAQDAAPAESATDAPNDADLEKATLLFQNGSTLFKEARYRDAITAWNEAYALTKKPELLYNIASAHERIGEYEEAIEVLNSYRAFATAEESGELERRINNLDRLDRENREKQEAAEAAAIAAAPSTTQPAESKASATGLIGIGLIGVGAAAVVTGVGFGLSSTSNGNSALEHCVDVDGDPLCSKAAEPFLAKNKSQALVADVAIGLGIASAAVGTILTISGRGKSVSVGANNVRFNTRF